MRSPWWLTGLICCVLGGAIPGCDSFQGAAADLDDDLFADLEEPAPAGDAPPAASTPPSDAGGAAAAMPPAAPRWRVGDRYPLEKTVFQKVTQVGLERLPPGPNACSSCCH